MSETHQLNEFILQLLQQLPYLEPRRITYEQIFDYDKFFRLYNVDILKALKEPKDDELNYTATICGAIVGIGIKYALKYPASEPIPRAITLKELSIYLFPENEDYQRRVLEFFHSLSLDDLHDFYTLFNAGITLPAIDYILLLRATKYITEGIITTLI